jgi:hypothetical protein
MGAKMGLSKSECLYRVLAEFDQIEGDPRRQNSVQISVGDALKSAYAIFSLKYSSLLQFETERRVRSGQPGNLERIYRLKRAPSDTQMREILDPLDPNCLRAVYRDLFSMVERGKLLRSFTFRKDRLNGPSYLIPLDGTGFFCSSRIHCENCLERTTSSGKQYYHNMLAGCIVHPDLKTVLPFPPEPILKQDGETKNDCEWHAAQRFLLKLKKEHPHLRAVITADALITKFPMIQLILELGYDYILAVKPGSHKGLFKYIDGAENRGNTRLYEWQETESSKVIKTIQCKVRVKENVPLSDKDSLEIGINFVEYWETTTWKDQEGGEKREEKHFSWVTSIGVRNDKQIRDIIKGGRARWKIENETFNTLKNQGYQFEHNFGHGKKNLATIFAMLMLLAFMIDQIQEMKSKKVRQLLQKINRTRLLDEIRNTYKTYQIENWEHLLDILVHRFFESYYVPPPIPPKDP